MGVPRFGEMVRRRYPDCWFGPGDVDVFEGIKLMLAGKLSEVDTLFVDGNGLLHPAMQMAFAYGMFQDDERRRLKIQGKSEDYLIREGVEFFLNAIRMLCLEFHPRRLVLAIDGSAPAAKMIQQRQRRFGAKMDLSKDASLEDAWKITLARNLKLNVQKEESFVNVKIIHNMTIKDGGQALIETGISEMTEGSVAKKIFDMVSTNLIEYSLGAKLRWYNLLDPETPSGFEYDGRGWYSLAAAATAMAFRDKYRTDTWVELLSTTDPKSLVIRMDSSNKFIYTNGRSLSADEQKTLKKYQDEYRDFKERNKEFFVTNSVSIANRLKDILRHITSTQTTLYADTLLRTGVGTNLVSNDGQTMNWLMEFRAATIQTKEREYYTRQVAGEAAAETEVEYPEFIEGFQGLASHGLFDSNSLTPGTRVMDMIDRGIQSNIRGGKMTVDENYSVEVEYSSHKIPGEGEHKIMNLIDMQKRPMGGKVDLIYGLDADLFMLSMVREHPICLIRENNFHVTKFFGKDDRRNKKRSSCHIVDIETLRTSLLRRGVHPRDFTLLSCLFGNDFLRNIPGFIFESRAREDNTPVVFDYLFTNTDGETPYTRLREQKISEKMIRPKDPLFLTTTTPVRVRWLYIYELLDRIAADENTIIDGMVNRMTQEMSQERLMKDVKEDYVPVNIRYKLLMECRSPKQVVVGGPLDQRGVITTDFRHGEFKEKWMSHITANIPGYRADGSAEGLTRNKSDVLKKICQTYLEGMEWVIKYYTNNHYIPTERKSILDTHWYYPYAHAPLVSQIRDSLREFIVEDSRRLFTVAVEQQGLRDAKSLVPFLNDLVEILFRVSPEHRDIYSKLERDVIDLLPKNYPRVGGARIPSSIADILWAHYSNLKERLQIPAVRQYTRSVESIVKGFPYSGENTFSERWMPPRPIFGEGRTLLVAPSTTNSRVQLLAVLPHQSVALFPEGASPSDEEISWMFPKTVPVDFTFRDRVHAAVIIIPPPNIRELETYLSNTRIRAIEAKIDEHVFPDNTSNWKISEDLIRRRTTYTDMQRFISDAVSEESIDTRSRCVDVMAGAGIASMAALSVFSKVTAFESRRDTFRDLVANVEMFKSSNEFIPENRFFKPGSAPQDAAMYIFDYPVGDGRKKTDTPKITFKTDYMPGPGVPLEGILEELISRFEGGSLDRLCILVKVPFFKKLEKIHTHLNIRTRYFTETGDGFNFKICRIVVSKRSEKQRYEESGYSGYGGESGYSAYQPRGDERYEEPGSPQYEAEESAYQPRRERVYEEPGSPQYEMEEPGYGHSGYAYY